MRELLSHPMILIGAWGFLGTVNLMIGWRQMRTGNGTLRQLISVATALATLQMLPIAAYSISSLLSGEEQPGSGQDSIFWRTPVLLLVSYVYLLVTLQSLRMPQRYGHYTGKLNLLSDPELLDQVARIAQALKIPVPVVYRLEGLGPNPTAAAWVGGLAAPSIMMTDGIELRLTTRERNAILAHEMAHISNHSLWWHLSAWSLCGTVTVVFAFLLQPILALPVGWACFTGVKNILSRHFEYDSDLRAARAVGFAAMITSLEKIHALLPVENRGWRSLLAFSTATHPSSEERSTALWKQAPSDDRPRPTWSIQTTAMRQQGAIIAFCVWSGLMIYFLLTSHLAAFIFPNLLLSTSTAIAPAVFLRLAIKQDYLQTIKRARPRRAPVRQGVLWMSFMLMVSAAMGLLAAVAEEYPFTIPYLIPYLILPLFSILLLLIPIGGWTLIRLMRANRIGHPHILRFVQNHQWAKCVSYYDQHARKFDNDPGSCYYVALARWELGEREQAEQELAVLRDRFPNYLQAWVGGAIMAIERNDFETGRQLATKLESQLKKDVVAHELTARCYLHLGDEEKTLCSLAAIARISPDSPLVPILRTQLAFQQNELSLSDLQEVEQTSPGSAMAYLLRAEYEWRSGSYELGREACKKFELIRNTTPFVFLGPEYRHLQQLMGKDSFLTTASIGHGNGADS